MIAVQLPDGAALGRTTAALDEATKIALATPGVKQVITIAGISVLDNSADLANAGVNYVIFDDWDKREKAKGTGLLIHCRGSAEEDQVASRTAGLSCSCRRRSRASAMPAASRCSSSCSAAASTTRS